MTGLPLFSPRRPNTCGNEGGLVINIASMPIAEKGMDNMLKLSPA